MNGPPVEDDPNPIRAPIPQRTEVLIPNSIVYRRQGKRRKAHSVFDQFRDFQAETMRSQDLVHNGGPGSSGRQTLRELFRPPVELMHRGSFQSARQAAASANRWLIATIHNTSEFQCQVLNRDVWSNAAIQELIRQRFVLWQAYSDSEDGRRFMTLYNIESGPNISIIDPRTGEKEMSWQKIEADAFKEIASDFLERHPAPSESDLDLRPAKRARTEPSIADASEDSQITAAIAASIRENSYQSADSTAVNTSDDDRNHLYSSDSDLETFSDSDGGRVPSSRPGSASQTTNQRFSIDDTIVNIPPTDNNATRTPADNSPSTSQRTDAETTREDERWKKYLGNDNDPMTTIIFRCPNNVRRHLSLPNSSTLMALVSYMSSLGYEEDRYELVTSFPKRHISRLDLSLTLKDSGINAQETLYIQEI